MTRKVAVSRAQKSAARAMVERSAVTGRPVSESVRKIAGASVQRIKETRTSGASSSSSRKTA